MKKINIKEFHRKYPYIDPFILLLFGGISGYIINGFFEKFTLKFWLNPYLFPLAIILTIIFIYFKKFSPYSNYTQKNALHKKKESFDVKLLELSEQKLKNCNTIDDMFILSDKVNDYYNKIS